MNKFLHSLARVPFVQKLALRILRSRLVTKRRIRSYLKHTDSPKLQIGYGPYPLKGWLNTGISLKEAYYGVYMDAGKPFPLPDESCEYVFSEHVFEHLTYPQAQNMLKESYRVLKPGGVIRIATPDLQFLMDLYQDPSKPLHKDYMEYSVKNRNMPPTPVYVISRFHTSWGHQIIYDKDTLFSFVQENGFKDLCFCKVGESSHPDLCGVESHFKFLPYDFDVLETMILEGTK